MSRDVVYASIIADPDLNNLGLDASSVFPNYSSDERPPGQGPFAILRWEDQPYTSGPFGESAGLRRGARHLTIWVHIPKQTSTDFTRIDAILDQIDLVLAPLEQVDGADGYTLTCITPTGRGADLRDEGFDTIVRNAGYRVLSRQT